MAQFFARILYTIGNVIRLAITFTPIIVYTTNNVTQSTFDHSIAHTIWLHIYMAYTWRTPTCFSCPLLLSPCTPLCSPFVFPSTYLAPSSCDRNRPPPSQVAGKLTPFAPPFTQLTHPPQIPRTPPALRLTTTTSGIFRLLLSETFLNGVFPIFLKAFLVALKFKVFGKHLNNFNF